MSAEQNVKLSKTSDLQDGEDILKEFVNRGMNEITKDSFHSMRINYNVKLYDCNITRIIIFNGC